MQNCCTFLSNNQVFCDWMNQCFWTNQWFNDLLIKCCHRLKNDVTYRKSHWKMLSCEIDQSGVYGALLPLKLRPNRLYLLKVKLFHTETMHVLKEQIHITHIYKLNDSLNRMIIQSIAVIYVCVPVIPASFTLICCQHGALHYVTGKQRNFRDGLSMLFHS